MFTSKTALILTALNSTISVKLFSRISYSGVKIIRGAFNMFPDIFVQGFKIVVDS